MESGLNDGIVTPVVLLAIAAAATAEGLADAPGTGRRWLSSPSGGWWGGRRRGRRWLLQRARSAGWASEDFAGIAVLALALLAYAAARGLHGNGFIAAFCGGVAFGAAAGRRGRAELVFLEQASGLVSLLVWLAFGAVAVPLVLERADLMTVLYAVLSLTAVRMLPVAVATARAGLDWETVLFVGWFGPRGLASLVFALLALEELGAGADDAVVVVAVTVVLSVLAHGATSEPLAERYRRAVAARGPSVVEASPTSPSEDCRDRLVTPVGGDHEPLLTRLVAGRAGPAPVGEGQARGQSPSSPSSPEIGE